jgi:hypothetical protein
MNIEIKNGRLLLTIADHFTDHQDSYMSNWVIKKKKLVLDGKTDMMVNHYRSVKSSLEEYQKTYDPSKPLRKVDDW